MNKKQGPFWSTPAGWAALGIIAAVLYFLLVEHRQHVFEFLPFLILLLCPLLHVFMHGSHGKHSEDQHDDSESNSFSESDTFQEKTKKNKAYRDGYFEGLKTGRDEQQHKEKRDGK